MDPVLRNALLFGLAVTLTIFLIFGERRQLGEPRACVGVACALRQGGDK